MGDVVRGGNVLGEEAYFTPGQPSYRESAAIESEDAAILQVNAACVAELGMETFASKGQN